MLEKRGQITSFIIIGIVVLVIGSILLYVVTQEKKETIITSRQEVVEISDLPSLQNYVEECIKKESQETIVILGKQGGKIRLDDYVSFNKTNISYTCVAEGLDPSFACANKILSRQEMQAELSLAMIPKLQECINLDAIKAQGKEVKEGNMKLNVSIGINDITFYLNYPITIISPERTLGAENFQIAVESPLGLLYELAMDITNEEITNEFFDMDKWMLDNNVAVLIKKSRPYPDVIYELIKDNYKFQFALEGTFSVGQERPQIKSAYGACINRLDNVCFKNSPQVFCRQINGEYVNSKDYACDFKTRIKGAEREFNDCGERKSGESWCRYDSMTGKGTDYVGSRHYKISCIDGEEYVEPCRDYREELCTEDAESKKAACRINRWQDCSVCETKDCCEDARFRDCYWEGAVTTEQKCMPEVSPGLKFWENQGGNVCFRANMFTDCPKGYLSCNDDWIESAAIMCYSMGDCGNYRNVEDAIAYSGFMHTDPFDDVRKYVYNPNGWNKNPQDDGTGWKIELPLDTRDRVKLKVKKEEKVVGNLPLMLSAGLSFLEKVIKTNVLAYLNPFQPLRTYYITDFAFCNLWQAPTGGSDCEKCSSGFGCTEYKCKSLGQLCVYEEIDGIGACKKAEEIDKNPPKIKFREDLLQEGYTAKRAILGDYVGVEIEQEIIPHKLFKFGIETNKNTTCGLNFAPANEIYNLPSFWFGDSAYKTVHQASLRMPPRLSVPQNVLDVLNYTSSSQFVEFVDHGEDVYRDYTKRLEPKFMLYKQVTGEDAEEAIDPYYRDVVGVLKALTPILKNVVTEMIKQFDKGGYYVFVQCEDKAGNTNKDQFFIKFTVAKEYKDTEPPVVLEFDPLNDTKLSSLQSIVNVNFYMDEPAECRYALADMDYSEMNKSFSCATSLFDVSTAAGGSYGCSGSMLVPNDVNTFYIRCMDNPVQAEGYKIRLNYTPEAGISGLEKYNASIIDPSIYVSISNGRIESPADMLFGLVFNVPEGDAPLRLYLPENRECRYGNSTQDFENMKNFSPCFVSTELERGLYACDALIEKMENAENKTADYYIECTDINRSERNVHHEGIAYTLGKSDLLKIVEISPSDKAGLDEELKVRVSKSISLDEISCGYNDNVFGGFIEMNPVSDNEFSAELEELKDGEVYSYWVQCTDKFGNEDLANTEFEVVG